MAPAANQATAYISATLFVFALGLNILRMRCKKLWKYPVSLSKLSVWGLAIPEQSWPSAESKDVSTEAQIVTITLCISETSSIEIAHSQHRLQALIQPHKRNNLQEIG